MAPATHLCDSGVDDSGFSDVEGETTHCDEDSAGKTTTNRGDNTLVTWTVSHRQDEGQGALIQIHTRRQVVYPDPGPPKSILKEPVFIAALVLTAVILVGGFVALKLANSPLPKRKVPTTGAGKTGTTSAKSSGTNSSLIQSSRGGSGRPELPLAAAAGTGTGTGSSAPDPRDRFSFFQIPEYTPSPLFNVVTASQDKPVPPEADTTPPPPPLPPTPPSAEEKSIAPEDSQRLPMVLPTIVLSEADDETLAESDWRLVPDEFEDIPLREEEKEGEPSSIPNERALEGHTIAHRPEISQTNRWSRSREESDSSHTTELSMPTELFSSSISHSSSMTSEAQRDDVVREDDDDESIGGEEAAVMDHEIHFEVKRGQTESLELVKGVLVNLPKDPPPEDNTKEIEENTPPNLDVSQTTRASNASPVHTSTSSPAMPLPALIVTEPSTMSLFTVASSTSNLSVELGQFPLPPLHLEPAVFWQKLEDKVNNSLALKRRSRLG